MDREHNPHLTGLTFDLFGLKIIPHYRVPEKINIFSILMILILTCVKMEGKSNVLISRGA